jgi:hypothetical protein
MRKKRGSKVGATATAKLEAVAKASYERKRTTSEVIPPDVTRAKASAWLDLVSPLTEWAGLKGDKLRYQRELIRVQREDVLTEIALRARKKIGGAAIKSIPNKFIMPFLEKASWEQPESELINTWANLLASAATAFDPHMVRFISVLAEMGPDEVRFIHRLCRECRSRKPLTFIEDVPLYFFSPNLLRSISEDIQPSLDHEANIKRVIAEHELPGGLILFLCIHDEEDGGAEVRHELADRKWGKSISLLQSLGIVENHPYISGERGQYQWYGEAVSLTAFGVEFVIACDREIGAQIHKVYEDGGFER